MVNLQVKLNLTKKQINKAIKGQTIQLDAETLRQAGNTLVNLDRKMGTKFNRAVKSGKGLRLQEGEYELDEQTQSKHGSGLKQIGRDLVHEASRQTKKAGLTKKQAGLVEELGTSFVNGAGVDEMDGGKLKNPFKKIGRVISNQAKKESKAIDKLSKNTGIDWKKEGKSFGKNALKTTAGVAIGVPLTMMTGNPIAGGIGSAVIMEKSGLHKKIDGLGFKPGYVSGNGLEPLVGDGNQFIESRNSKYGSGIRRTSGGSFTPYVYSNETKGSGLKRGGSFIPN